MATFHPFSRLAPELRHRIWEFTVEPRAILVQEHCDVDFDKTASIKEWIDFSNQRKVLKFKSMPPAAFGVCRESRAYLQRSYTAVFTTKPQTPLACSDASQCTPGIPTWVNFGIDTICCGQYMLRLLSKLSWVSRIENVTVDIEYHKALRREMGPSPDLDYIERDMANLKHLTFKDSDERPDIPPGESPCFAEDWRRKWYDLLAGWYNCCVPSVGFSTRVVNLNVPETGELNETNFMRTWRNTYALRRFGRPDDYESDSEEDFNTRNRPFRWTHNSADCVTKCKTGSGAF